MPSIDKIYDQHSLERSMTANMGREFQRCSMSVMDTIADPNIEFDADGVCHYYHDYLRAEDEQVFPGDDGNQKIEEMLKKIQANKGGSKYDCILGLSGGVDSTYLCLKAKEWGLNPLIVHCDNGWNSELAQHNVERTIKKLGFDLYTYVIDWREFREMQLSYLKASVVDIEVLTDHAFMSVLYTQARKWKIKYVLAGMNIVTEHVLPKHWIYSKGDDVNIKAIQNTHGTKKASELKTFPFLDYKTRRYCQDILKMEVLAPLNYMEYIYEDVKKQIIDKLDWRDYGGKHYESVWTRFYQGYILPRKFNIDKRKAHFSNLIFSGQMTREEALEKLNRAPYPDQQLFDDDYEFVIKKLGLSEKEFETMMDNHRREHTEFKTQKGFWAKYPLFRPLRKLLGR